MQVDYASPAGAPEHLFVKLPPREPERRRHIAATGMGPKEVRFYDELASRTPLRTPELHGAALDEESGDFVLVLEDLVASDCTIPDGTRGVTPDAAARALEELARFHAHHLDPRVRAVEAAWVAPAGPGSDYAIGMLRHGIEHHRDRLDDTFVAVAELYCAHRLEMQALWHPQPWTVVHGDPHLGNVFDDHGRIGFLDWGIVMRSTSLRDVSYFLTMAMDPEDRRRHEETLLRLYLAAFAAEGGPETSFDEAWSAHRLQAAYTVPASCQVVTFPDDATPRRRSFAEAFLARATAAVDDLDALGALHAAGLGSRR
nr:ecdysteroid 22-kinase family protein [Rhabdothermincola salaria]